MKANANLSLPPVLQLFLLMEAFLYAVCAATKVICRLVLNLRFQYSHIYLDEYFPDFFNVNPAFADFHHIQFYTGSHIIPVMYPAPVAAAYEVFALTGKYAFYIFMGFILAAFATAAVLLCRRLVRRGVSLPSSAFFVGGSVILSYPLIFEYKQANIEIVVWVLLALALWAFFTRHPYLAAAAIGTASAMKIFPLVYLGLLLSTKRYRAFVLGLFTTFAVTLISLWLTYPDIIFSWRATNANVDLFRIQYMLRLRGESGYDHSIWGLLKVLYVFLTRHQLPSGQVVAPYLTMYLAAIAITGLMLYFLRIKNLPLTNQALCLCIASILFPPTSFDYTLLHLYGPWAIFTLVAVQHWRSGTPVPQLGWLFAYFAFILAPESEFILGGMMLGGQMKALALIGLLLLTLRYPFPELTLAKPDPDFLKAPTLAPA